jgi:hypothetical protein
MSEELTAENLKSALWEALKQVRDDKMDAGRADAIACQAREILRTTNTQLRIFQQAKRPVSPKVIEFGEK